MKTRSLINETITIQKAFSIFNQIPQETIQQLVQCDPTYKGGQNVGKYFTWIANSYLKDNSIINNPQYTKEILSTFKDNQNRFDTNVQLKSFSSIKQIAQFLQEQGVYEETNEITSNIDNKEVREGTNVVLNGETWLIIVPENYETARHWGAGTNWCTAADNDGYYYNYYLNENGGKYYILINKQNPEEKYQFHFESQQFMDKDDTQIESNVYSLDNFDELNDFFSNEIGSDWDEQVENPHTNQWQVGEDFGNEYYIGHNEDGEYAIVDENGQNQLPENLVLSEINFDKEYNWAYVKRADNGRKGIIDTKLNFIIDLSWDEISDFYYMDCNGITREFFICGLEGRRYIVLVGDVYYGGDVESDAMKEIKVFTLDYKYVYVYHPGKGHNLFDMENLELFSKQWFDDIETDENNGEINATLNGIEGYINLEKGIFYPYEDEEDDEEEQQQPTQQYENLRYLVQQITESVLHKLNII